MNAKPGPQGFSLLEVLVAFAILALAVGILLKIFSGGARTAVLAEEYTAAVQIANSLMARVGVETLLQPDYMQGVRDGRYAWRVRVSPYWFNPTELDPDTVNVAMYKVEVAVDWGDEGRQVYLTTLKLGKRQVIGGGARPAGGQAAGGAGAR